MAEPTTQNLSPGTSSDDRLARLEAQNELLMQLLQGSQSGLSLREKFEADSVLQRWGDQLRSDVEEGGEAPEDADEGLTLNSLAHRIDEVFGDGWTPDGGYDALQLDRVPYLDYDPDKETGPDADE